MLSNITIIFNIIIMMLQEQISHLSQDTDHFLPQSINPFYDEKHDSPFQTLNYHLPMHGFGRRAFCRLSLFSILTLPFNK